MKDERSDTVSLCLVLSEQVLGDEAREITIVDSQGD